MCWSCGCGELEQSHSDARNIVTADLQGAADAQGISVPQAVANIVLSLAHFDPQLAKAVGAVETPYASYQVMKSTPERRFTLGLAYPALKPDTAKAADGHIDAVRPEVLENTAWSWLAKYRDVGLHHADGTSGHFTPTESYIYRGPDWETVSPVDGEPYIIKAGDWLLGGVWDEYGWTLVKNGRVRGWSPQGGARRQKASPEFLAQLRT